jgi:hypothetical protein
MVPIVAAATVSARVTAAKLECMVGSSRTLGYEREDRPGAASPL